MGYNRIYLTYNMRVKFGLGRRHVQNKRDRGNTVKGCTRQDLIRDDHIRRELDVAESLNDIIFMNRTEWYLDYTWKEWIQLHLQEKP